MIKNKSYKKISIAIISILLSSICITVSAQTYGIQTKTANCIANKALPDSACTPGAILTTSTTTICKVGYTTTVRDVTTATKQKVFKEYGISWSLHSNYEVDHLISLELGGSNDISNLFPESYLITNGARIKDKLENYLHSQICSGKMSVKEAQKEISTNWVYYYDIYYNKKATTTIPIIIVPAVIKTVNKVVATTSIIRAPVTTPLTNLPAVKKSSTGLCHARGTQYYNQTLKYTAYDSINACLSSGGRLTK